LPKNGPSLFCFLSGKPVYYRHRRKLPRLFPAGRSGEIQRFSVNSDWTAIRGDEKAFSIPDGKAFSRGIDEKVLKKSF
jgi:hypothetical protein